MCHRHRVDTRAGVRVVENLVVSASPRRAEVAARAGRPGRGDTGPTGDRGGTCPHCSGDSVARYWPWGVVVVGSTTRVQAGQGAPGCCVDLHDHREQVPAVGDQHADRMVVVLGDGMRPEVQRGQRLSSAQVSAIAELTGVGSALTPVPPATSRS